MGNMLYRMPNNSSEPEVVLARIPYIEPEAVAPEVADVIASGANLHRLTCYNPGLARASRQLGLYLRRESPLDARLRELAILQVAYCLGAVYEYAHHLEIAIRDVGMSNEELLAIAIDTEGGESELDDTARLVLRAARYLAVNPELPADQVAELAAVLPPAHLVDLLFAIGFYVGLSRLAMSLDLDLEPKYEPYLSRFPIR